MTPEIANGMQIQSVGEMIAETIEEEFETIGDYHRRAAHYFAEAAKHHLAAAHADDMGDGRRRGNTRL